MKWTAIVPIKPPDERKTRLSPLLSPDERAHLGDEMLRHVLDKLQPVIERNQIIILSRTAVSWWRGGTAIDPGIGLNLALAQCAERVQGPLLVVHADLPALSTMDVKTIIQAAKIGAAIAPDRHRSGTNALGFIDPRKAIFAFGTESFTVHQVRLPHAAIVNRPGLEMDLDTADDIAALLSRGLLSSDIRSRLARTSLGHNS